MEAGARVRLFVALDLPAQAREALTAWRAPLLGGSGGALRPVAPDALHVTLCFLGSLPEAVVGSVGEAVERAVRAVGDAGALGAPDAPGAAGAPGARGVPRTPAAMLTFGEALWLPRRRPRVLAVELADGDGSLATVQAAVARELEAGGWFRPEPRPFLPHVTVARVRGSVARGAGHAREPGAVGAPPPAPPPLRFAGTAVTLYRSLLGGGPARYEPLARVPLR